MKAYLAALFLLVLASAAFAQYRQQCQAITRRGEQCQNLAMPFSLYCRVHCPFR